MDDLGEPLFQEPPRWRFLDRFNLWSCWCFDVLKIWSPIGMGWWTENAFNILYWAQKPPQAEDGVEGGEQADVSTLGEAQSASGESTWVPVQWQVTRQLGKAAMLWYWHGCWQRDITMVLSWDDIMCKEWMWLSSDHQTFNARFGDVWFNGLTRGTAIFLDDTEVCSSDPWKSALWCAKDHRRLRDLWRCE